MDFKEYSKRCRETDLFPPREGTMSVDLVAYRTLCLCGETGELANKVKKIRRDDYILTDENRAGIIYELGDIMWYLSILCDILDTDLEEVARLNIDKLASRKAAGKIQGNGDHRIAKDVDPDDTDRMHQAIQAREKLAGEIRSNIQFKERQGNKYIFSIMRRRAPGSPSWIHNNEWFDTIRKHGFKVHLMAVRWDEQTIEIRLEYDTDE